MSREETMDVATEPLTQDSFSVYGDVVAKGRMVGGPHSQVANQGTARRENHLTPLVNLREEHPRAQANVCIFNCTPPMALAVDSNRFTFPCRLLERHLFSSQMFVPTGAPPGASYLVIVALNDAVRDEPDLTTLRAFVCSGGQGVNYRAGVWHHPMVALPNTDGILSFVCIVYERGRAQLRDDEDTEEVAINGTLSIHGKVANTPKHRL